MQTTMKVGALAKRTGLTVRTLHHYDEIGLLSPAHRTRSGHRLYGEEELSRLQQIASLKHLGLPLEEICECLTRPEYSLERVLNLQIERLAEQIRRHEHLRALVEALRDRVVSGDRVSVHDLAHSVALTVTTPSTTHHNSWPSWTGARPKSVATAWNRLSRSGPSSSPHTVARWMSEFPPITNPYRRWRVVPPNS